MALEKTNLENSGGQGRHKKWPKFYGFTFSPESLSTTKAGGNIDDDDESPSEALQMICEYFADLFKLASDESALRAFWSASHRAWVFYSPEKLQSLGYGPRSLCEHTVQTFKKKEKFYSEILAHHRKQKSELLQSATPGQ